MSWVFFHSKLSGASWFYDSVTKGRWLCRDLHLGYVTLPQEWNSWLRLDSGVGRGGRRWEIPDTLQNVLGNQRKCRPQNLMFESWFLEPGGSFICHFSRLGETVGIKVGISMRRGMFASSVYVRKKKQKKNTSIFIRKLRNLLLDFLQHIKGTQGNFYVVSWPPVPSPTEPPPPLPLVPHTFQNIDTHAHRVAVPSGSIGCRLT